ncbi:hypothetical protein EJ04DRAFT_557187 [Polyplosphaeria fusca]|uniref:SEP domain-containing protein n=1 Tax=Polyplosphaeria fusca TaxID=682080 RepID=A0A9P4QI61_9PLEO|nr:hypothetical protein EJ04DRAFT_557187 [Polyplosphaeria fusca]
MASPSPAALSFDPRVVEFIGTDRRLTYKEILDTVNTGAVFQIYGNSSGSAVWIVVVIFLDATSAVQYISQYPEGSMMISSQKIKITYGELNGDENGGLRYIPSEQEQSMIADHGMSRALVVWRLPLKPEHDVQVPVGQSTEQDHQVHLWKDGYSADSGALRTYDGDEDKQLLDELYNGRASSELFGQPPGQVVNVELIRHDGIYKSPNEREHRVPGYISTLEKLHAQEFKLDKLDPQTMVQVQRVDSSLVKDRVGVLVEFSGIQQAAEAVDQLRSEPPLKGFQYEFVADRCEGGGFTIKGPCDPLMVAKINNPFAPPPPAILETWRPIFRLQKRASEAGLDKEELWWEMCDWFRRQEVTFRKKASEQKAAIKRAEETGEELDDEWKNRTFLNTDWRCEECAQSHPQKGHNFDSRNAGKGCYFCNAIPWVKLKEENKARIEEVLEFRKNNDGPYEEAGPFCTDNVTFLRNPDGAPSVFPLRGQFSPQATPSV